jgi:hypothetical protein
MSGWNKGNGDERTNIYSITRVLESQNLASVQLDHLGLFVRNSMTKSASENLQSQGRAFCRPIGNGIFKCICMSY